MSTEPAAAVIDRAAEQTVLQLVATAGLERSVRRMAETTLAVAELARRMDEAGFGRLATAVRSAAEGTLVGLLAGPPAGPDVPAPPPAAPPALPPRRGGKPTA